MNKNIFKYKIKVSFAAVLFLCMGLLSCNDQPDTSNLYTFTGETIEDFLTNRSEQFSDFNYILQRSGYDRIMSAYGSYTCFAPTNAAVMTYIDSLYNDKENELEHNGMTSNSLEGLTDSLCRDIAEFHLCNDAFETIDMAGNGITIPTMLGRSVITSVDTAGHTVLNDKAVITGQDNEVVNGYVQIVNNVIPRSNRLMSSELSRHAQYSIFNEALKRTGLADSLLQTEVTRDFVAPTAEAGFYIPTKSKVGYTIFAETDDILKKAGITSFDKLVEYANKVYAHAADQKSSALDTLGWYDYYRNNKISVSTGNDYTKRNNALNMFIAYHILKYSLAKDKIVSEWGVWSSNGYNGDVYDYYETMLPKTLIKAWKVKSLGKIFINRYIRNNTLTDGAETMGSDDMHEVMRSGVVINTDSLIQPLNGYIYPLNSILAYDRYVPTGVLHERMRFDSMSLLPEAMSNDFRGTTMPIVAGWNGGTSAARIRFPYNYFDNIKVYNGNNTTIQMNIKSAPGYLLYQGDSFQGIGQYDLAIKLPPVPDGLYELRVDISLMDHGSMLQYYLGTSSDLSSMEAVDIPLDMRMDGDDPRIGWTDPQLESDKGITTDKAMRNRGYMRGPLSMTKEGINFVSRFHTYQVRRILTKRELKQQDYWLRLKTVLPDVSNGKFQLDFVEIVPVSVSENENYLEDMY